MDTFSPIFSKIVDSSLWEEPDWVVKVFLTMLALKDADHVVRHNAYALGRKCWPKDDTAEARVMEALKVLSSPDKRRLEPQPHQGRRIAKVDEGWLVLNGAAYRKMAQELSERMRKAKWAREHRGVVINPEADQSVENKKDLIHLHETHAANLKAELKDGYRQATT